MTLDDAIAHAREVAAGCGECAEEHAQLADWLDELRALKALKEDDEAMSMLGEQIKELREKADKLREHGTFVGYGGNVNTDPLMHDAAILMREAVGTIEGLRDRLQELQGVGGESRYTALFGTPERVARTLERLHVEWSDWCAVFSRCRDCMFGRVDGERVICWEPDDFSLVEWLRGDA